MAQWWTLMVSHSVYLDAEDTSATAKPDVTRYALVP
jgi:hypothetical protein